MTFLRKHAGAIEADFARYYSSDIWADYGAGRIDLRRIKTLVEHLPDDAATWRSVHGEAASWTRADVFAARAVFALEGANWQRSGGKGRRPQFVGPPPSKVKQERRQALIADAKRRIAERNRQEVTVDG